mmetsp:Transcript_75107/g.208887  ORF Transcript_75107/g.208887 Transcript_75107/m.208887 type:complete len:510 (-) Transcript_75107:277-1806(-)
MEPSRYVCAKPFAPVSRLGSYSSAPPALFTTAPCKACKAARAQLQSTSALPATRAIRPRSSDSKSLGVLVGVAAAACCSPRPQRGRSISSIVRCCDIESRSAKLRLLEELRAMRARDLKRRLQTLGLSTEGRVDKESLLELLERSDIDVLDATPSSRSGDEPGGGSSRSSSGSSSSRAADDVYSSAGAADRLQELRALRARDLRRELVSLGLNTQGCMDKQSLLELLETNAAFVLERTSCSAVSVPIHLLATQDQLGIQMEGRHITVDLVLGGLPYRFVMDTGASHTLIMQSMASALQAQDMGMPAWATGAMGTQSGMRLVSVPDAHLGPLSCSPLPLVLTPQSLPIPVGVAGIVGLDFIARFDWDIDVAAGQARVATAGWGPRRPHRRAAAVARGTQRFHFGQVHGSRGYRRCCHALQCCRCSCTRLGPCRVTRHRERCCRLRWQPCSGPRGLASSRHRRRTRWSREYGDHRDSGRLAVLCPVGSPGLRSGCASWPGRTREVSVGSIS